MAAIPTTATTCAAAPSSRKRGIHYLDVGTSGGIAGGENGYCLMIGGEKPAADSLEPLFAALSPGGRLTTPADMTGTAARGYLHCGAYGAGHFVKMIHNGIEYGVMAAYAEGFNILRNANIGTRPREKDAETTPLQHPGALRLRLRRRADRRSLAPRQRGALLAARSHRARAGRRREPRRHSPAASRIRVKDAGPWRPRWMKACPRR